MPSRTTCFEEACFEEISVAAAGFTRVTCGCIETPPLRLAKLFFWAAASGGVPALFAVEDQDGVDPAAGVNGGQSFY
jgi:hypothetical protein